MTPIRVHGETAGSRDGEKGIVTDFDWAQSSGLSACEGTEPAELRQTSTAE